jgi:transcriptional regulator GlxA family with amidase domain
MAPKSQTVAFVVFDGFSLLDVVGPSDVLTIANQQMEAIERSAAPTGPDPSPRYEQRIAAPQAGPVTAESGLRLVADTTLSDLRPPHTLVVAGGDGVEQLLADSNSLEAISRLAHRSSRVVSICTGAFVLAELGLLDRRRATTHWASASQLADRYPAVKVTPDELFVRDGPVMTSAGIAAGIDLALALVADDHGSELARTVSRRMVLYLQRTGGQSQFSERLDYRAAPEPDHLDRLLAEIADDPSGDLSNPALAARLSVGERQLSRVFVNRTGTTPARWVARVRVDHGRRLLEQTALPVEQIAQRAGFGSVHTMRQVFHRVVGLSPDHYRRHHQVDPPAKQAN